jgi:hypothetical protein
VLKLLRTALTAAVLVAIAVRLRRRARLPEIPPARPAPPPGNRLDGLGVLVAGTMAVLGGLAFLGPGLWPGQRVDDPYSITGHPVPQAVPTRTAGPIVPATTEQPAVVLPALPDPHCDPAPGPVTVRPLDPAVKRAVDRRWRRVERWLRANAPKTYATLGRPGRARTIAVAEAQMGVRFPDDLRASLLRHNGARGFGFGYWFDGAVNLGIRGIRDSWRELCARDGTDLGPWNGRMIPYLYYPGREEGGLEYATVDAADGTVIWDDEAGMAPRHSSYYALMGAVADALETGAPLDGRRPEVRRGTLRWELAE